MNYHYRFSKPYYESSKRLSPTSIATHARRVCW